MKTQDDKKNKICYVASVDVTIKFILLNQLKFLKREGCDVYVVCSLGKWTGDIEKEGIKIKNIRFKRKISPIFDLISLIRLFFYFKREKFDIVHTHTPKAGLIGQLSAKFAGVPIIINTIHGFYFQKKDSWLKRQFFIFTEKIAAMCSDVIFFVNREDMDTAVKEKICSSDKIKYFGAGIEMERFDIRRFSKKFIYEKKKQVGIKLNGKIIGIVARLVKEKGYLDLFKAFKKVLDYFPETTLLVVGSLEPEKKDAINPVVFKKYKIKKNLLFLGERTDIDEIYSLMDIFILPSYREGLGISIIEASAMAKPVVATDIRGCREAVEDGVTGKLVPAGDVHKLSEAIVYLIGHPKEAEEMGKRGKLKVNNEFDEKKVFDKIEKEYEMLIRKKIK